MAKHSKKSNKLNHINKKCFLIILLLLLFILTFIGINLNNKNSSMQISKLKENSYLNKLEQELINQNDENLISNKYLVTDNTIERIKENTKVEEFLKDFNNEIKLYKDEKMEEEVSTGIILGSMCVEDKDGNIYNLIVDGDVNKDGFVNQIDISKIIRKELPDIVAEKASKVGIEKISDKIVYGKFDLGEIKDVISPEIEVVNGTLAENNCYISDVTIKVKQKEPEAIKTVYQVKGSKEKEISEILENEEIVFNEDGTIQLTQYLGNNTEIIVPANYDGNLVIPDSVKKIGKYAFYNCSGFTGDLNIPNEVKSIDYGAFYHCIGFNGNLNLSNNLEIIGDNAFMECSGLTGDLVIPNSVKSIGDVVFQDCKGLNGTLTLSENISEIGNFDFFGCTGLTGDIIIPEGVTSIRERALYYNQQYYIKASKKYIPASLENITDDQISSLNNISQKIEVSPDNTKFIVDANNKLIRK